MPDERKADVIVPVYRDTAMTRRCLESVLARSGAALRSLIVIDDGSPEPAMFRSLRDLADRDPRVRLLRNESNLGFVGTCNRGLAERGGDAVLLNSDTLVTSGWLQELAQVVNADERTACASPLSNNATICSVPEFCQETPADQVDEATVRAACAGLPRSTIIPTAHGFCLYLRAEVLDLIGHLDPVFAPGYNEENDWVMRAQVMGFIARRANHAFVHHLGSASFLAEKTRLEARNARILNERHPHYLPQVRSFCGTLDAHVPAHAVRVESTGRLRVALDLRHVMKQAVGTNVYASSLARELARSTEIALTLVVREPYQAKGLPGRVVREDRRIDDVEVIHKPAQVFNDQDLPILFNSPAHAVISHLDMIAHHAQAIFNTPSTAAKYRATSYLALQAAQATIAISQNAKQEIVAAHAIPESEVTVTPLGIEPVFLRTNEADDRTLGFPNRFFLSVGTDFPHKNLHNLLDAYTLLRRDWGDGEPPSLVLIGSKTSVADGCYGRLSDGTIPGVVYVGSVSTAELWRLYRESVAMVFPSVYEGFGLPIIEAMAAGTPVIALPFSTIPEVGGDAVLLADGAKPRDLARVMTRVATDPELRADTIARGLTRSRDFRWDRTAKLTIDVYKAVVRRPSERSLLARRHLAQVIAQWSRRSLDSAETDSVGIKNAWKELDHAVRVRARRELGRLKLRRLDRSA